MKSKLFLYLTTFVCGAAIMGVEIASSRFMAPYFGSSMITWTVIIGVILVAMSLGNFAGGRLADRSDPQQKLYQLILWAAIWVALIPIVGKYLIAAVAGAAIFLFPGNPVLAGSVIACVMLFAVPCVILGATSPCMIKAATSNLDSNGRIAGEIYGLSTLGSICGTFLPTFVTIPLLGTDRTFYLFAGVLCSLTVINALRNRSGGKKAVALLLLIVGIAFSSFSVPFVFWEKPLLETESVYNYLLVKEKDGVRTLSTHVVLGTQSMYSSKPGLTGLYYDLALLAYFFLPAVKVEEPLPVLILGFATGTFARLSRQFFPETFIDGVEIDSEIVRLGREYFDLRADDARVFVEDGRMFVKRSDKKYRVIFLDAFQDVTYPFHMATREFFAELTQRLSDDGVLAINVNMRSQQQPDICDYLTGTLAEVFPTVILCEHPHYYNRIIFASKKPQMQSIFNQRISSLPDDHPLHDIATQARSGLSPAKESRYVLTDDLAPVELTGFRMLNQQITGAFREILMRVILLVKDSMA
ncbi:MAG: spermidine synthase [Candidatus Riflebacteria bacterium HGW-Riflebacteria-2]|jgi:spermidine synthase|nr:MAG: spermidine synthase [Candidatus Riflebacteria bacterium HGW-Riflebacteria-2]